MSSARIAEQLRVAKRLASTVRGQLERLQRSPGNMVLSGEISSNIETLHRHDQVLQREIAMLSMGEQPEWQRHVVRASDCAFA